MQLVIGLLSHDVILPNFELTMFKSHNMAMVHFRISDVVKIEMFHTLGFFSPNS